jgi:hypothetical protein
MAGPQDNGSPGPVGGILNQLQMDSRTLTAILQAIKALATPLGVFTTGSWTPTLAFGGASTGITYSTQFGRFATVGNLVIASFAITLTSNGSATGSATIGGLPVASGSVVPQSAGNGIVAVYSGLSSLTGEPHLGVPASSSSVSLLSAGASASAALTNANFTSTSAFSGTFQYWSS